LIERQIRLIAFETKRRRLGLDALHHLDVHRRGAARLHLHQRELADAIVDARLRQHVDLWIEVAVGVVERGEAVGVRLHVDEAKVPVTFSQPLRADRGRELGHLRLGSGRLQEQPERPAQALGDGRVSLEIRHPAQRLRLVDAGAASGKQREEQKAAHRARGPYGKPLESAKAAQY
jgi:hypothetical protein